MDPETIMEKVESIENKFVGEDFSTEKYINDVLLGQSFAFSHKIQRLNDVKKISNETEKTYKNTSNQFVDILLTNYSTFINIGKFVDKIDQNISDLMNAQKDYSNLIQSLRKDVEEFSFSYSKYLKDSKNQNEKISKKNEEIYTFEEIENFDSIEKNFNLDEFLNPSKGKKKWLEEQPERMRVLIDEKKFDDAVNLVKEIRESDLGSIDFETRILMDDTYNYLIEKLTLNIGRSSSSSEVKYYLEKMKILGCQSLAVDTYLSWLSKKLRNKIQKFISNKKDDDEFIKKKTKKKSILKTLNNNSIKSNLNIIKEEDENKIIEEEDVKENEEEENENNNNNAINTIQSENVEELIKNDNYQIHKKIIQIITEYFNSLTKYIKIMNDYFNLNSNPAYSSYLILWYKQEFLSMNKQIEHLFSRVKTIHELQAIMNFLTILFTQLDEQGNSSKFIYDQYFINNLKITLESIVNFCMKNEIIGVSFDLKKYEINFNNKKIILHSVAELGISIFNISMIIIEFLTKFITIKKKFIGIVFLEEFLFENILLKDFLDFIKSKIDKNISNNYDVKPFGDTNESIASSNQILINYGITIISIEKLFKFFSNEIEINNEINQTSKQSFLYLIKQINEEKINYFSNLLKVKIESHFYKFFDSQKDLLMKNSNENYDKIERAFLIFIYLIKNLTKMLKNRIVDENEIKNEIINYFILDSQYVNFLNIIGNIKNLNEFYDTEFNLSQIGSIGIEIIINGIWFVYFCVINLLNLKNENKFKNVTVNFIEDILKSWSELKNVSIDKFLKNMNFYQSNIVNYINANKNEIFKGFNFD